MTLQHDNATSHTARSVSDFLQDRNVSVLPWPAKSLDLNTIEHVWDLLNLRVRARAIPPRNVWELAGALVEEWGNISQQLENPWGGDALQYLMQLVATPDTDCYFWFWPPLCSGAHYSIPVSHMSVELLQLLNLVMLFTHVKFAENKCSWQWDDVSFFAEFILHSTLLPWDKLSWVFGYSLLFHSML